MTPDSARRIRKLYKETIGYDPCDPKEGGISAAEALQTLKEYRDEVRNS